MNSDLENKLAKDFSFMRWQRVGADGEDASVTNTYVAFGCEVGDGWYVLLHDLCEQIQETYKRYGAEVDIVIDQVKEKYGGLRFYYHREGRLTDEIADEMVSQRLEDIVQQYEDRSEHICEDCGKEGRLREDLSWILTLCDNCYEKMHRGRS